MGGRYDMRRGAAEKRSAKKDAIIRWAVDFRRDNARMKYVDLEAAIMDRFDCSKRTAQLALTAAADVLGREFNDFCRDAPRIIFDSYMDIHAEAMSEKNWTAARRALDSVRDMFGLRSAINININQNPNAPPASSYRNLTDTQLEALSALDQLAPPILDVPSVERAIGDAQTMSEALEIVEDMHDVDE